MRFHFFVGEPSRPGWAAYEHNFVALAQGLVALGHKVTGSKNYWPLGSGGFLIPAGIPEGADVYLISHHWYEAGIPVPELLSRTGSRARVLIDAADGWRTLASERSTVAPFDLVLKCHFNDHYRWDRRVVPWAFGLCDRIVEYTAESLPWVKRKAELLWNFRVAHAVRHWGEKILRRSTFPLICEVIGDGTTDDVDRVFSELTGGRHVPAYYERLKTTAFLPAFGGFFRPAWSSQILSKVNGLVQRIMEKTDLGTKTVVQFDSWRFWEGLGAACVVMHADFEYFGMKLPVMPLSYEHYVGFRNGGRRERHRLEQTSGEEWSRISRSGREWALAHYGPRPTAERLLQLIA